MTPTLADRTFYRPCWAEINLSALRHNFQTVKGHLSPATRLLAVVKANAYGHGLVEVARVTLEEGAAFLGVSSIEEGILLRQAGIQHPVLVLGSLYPFENFSAILEYQLTPTIASLAAAERLDGLTRPRGLRWPVHLKLDTGFGRIGVSRAHALDFIRKAAGLEGLVLEGIYTHFATSDTDPAYTQEQIRQFKGLLQAARQQGIRIPIAHAANSAALLRFPETHLELVRPGISLYGVAPFPMPEADLALEPALCWKTRVIYVKTVPPGCSISYGRTYVSTRPTRVATLAVGYADGYPRLLSNRGEVLLRGRRVQVIGRVTMDMMMVDATDLPDCRVGDEAVLLGSAGGAGDRIAVEELARWAQTHVYEILCGIRERVPRIYLHG